MLPDQTTHTRTVRNAAGDASDGRTTPRSEDLHLRSYAHEWAYDVAVEVRTLDGDVVFEADYYLRPGDAESELDTLPAGEYEVRATLDNDRRETVRCRIGDAPEQTAVIEVGNGVLSLTEGLPSR